MTYRWWLIIITILLVAIIASGARFLTFDNDVRMYFSEENPQLTALEALENTYSKDENVLFVLAPKSKNVFTRESLAALVDRAMSRELWLHLAGMKTPTPAMAEIRTNI